jgi:hypothetical protein
MCGTKSTLKSKFCSECGATLGKSDDSEALASFPIGELRIPYGTATADTLPLDQQNSEIVSIPRTSELAKNAGSPFSPLEVPTQGDLVPLNCAWAFVLHPGSFPSDPGGFAAIDKKFVAMGTLVGRTFHEIEAVAGPPMTRVAFVGGFNAVWGKTGFLSIWQIALQFDPYGVCVGITAETNM